MVLGVVEVGLAECEGIGWLGALDGLDVEDQRTGGNDAGDE